MKLKSLPLVCLIFTTSIGFSQNLPIVLPKDFHAGNLFWGSSYIPKTTLEKNSNQYLFTILYKDSTKETLPSKIDSYNDKFFLAIKQPGMVKSIKPSQTVSISRVSEDGELFTGLATDSCWLFKIKGKKINLYSVLAETKTKFAVVFQNGETEPILPLTYPNLDAIIPKNTSARAEFEKGKFIKAIELYNNGK